jgi:hypothetical protein
MTENATQEGLLVRAEPLEKAEEISHRMVDVVRLKDGGLLLDADLKLVEPIKKVLAKKGVEIKEMRKVFKAELLIA